MKCSRRNASQRRLDARAERSFNGNSQDHLLMSLNGSSGGFCLLAGNRISSRLENGSWDVARKEKKRDLTRRPSRRELERDARGQRKETGGGTKNKQEPAGAGPEKQRPGTREAPTRQARTERSQDTRAETRFAFESAGPWVGALCPVLGPAPEGSATEPSAF